MVLTFLLQSNNNPHCKYGIEIWQLLGLCLKEMVDEVYFMSLDFVL